MYRAVIEAKKKKPVIASMGDVAASGGYYVAMGADEIWASPTTLTGSIGVFFAKPAVRDFANKLGVFQESLNRGRNAGLTDLFDPWTDEQRAVAQGWVDDFYDTFITEVAASRKLDKAAVDAVARGRVWSGEDAKTRGLVDNLGGLMDAVAAAKTKAGLASDDRDVSVSLYQPTSGVLTTVLSATAPSALLDLPLPSAKLPLGLDALLEQLGPDAWLLTKPTVQARMEFSLELR
jgi:protease-4